MGFQRRRRAPVEAWRHMGVEKKVLALDCTNPSMQDWLRQLFRTMVDEWGIDLFKIDSVSLLHFPAGTMILPPPGRWPSDKGWRRSAKP